MQGGREWLWVIPLKIRCWKPQLLGLGMNSLEFKQVEQQILFQPDTYLSLFS
jgi:hypothetical protein